MKLATIRNCIDAYDAYKGIWRRIFGDDEGIHSLKLFYAQHANKKSLNAEEQIQLIELLDHKKNYNPRLSGVLIRRLLGEFSISKLILKSEKKLLSEDELEYFQDNKQQILKILDYIKDINGLSLAVVRAVLKHQNLDELTEITHSLSYKSCHSFNEKQLITIFQQSKYYSDPAVLNLFRVSPLALLTTDAIDTMIIESDTAKNKVLSIVSFLNRLIGFAKTNLNHQLFSKDKAGAPLTAVTLKSAPVARKSKVFPSRFNFWKELKHDYEGLSVRSHKNLSEARTFLEQDSTPKTTISLTIRNP